MKSYLLTGIFSLFICLSYAQKNPLDYFAGEWVQKTQSIDPAPENENYKSQVSINEFVPILDGKGLYRIAKAGNITLEGFFFYDVGSGKVFGMSVDENGYVWQTETTMDADGKPIGSTGKALSDPSVGLESKLKVIDKNEFHFEQTYFADGKKNKEVKGIFIRIF